MLTTKQFQSKNNGESVGYKITVTDGGDESSVNYYIKIDVGLEDIAHWPPSGIRGCLLICDRSNLMAVRYFFEFNIL